LDYFSNSTKNQIFTYFLENIEKYYKILVQGEKREVIVATNGYGFQKKNGGLEFTKKCTI
jgi:hypothetical protein